MQKFSLALLALAGSLTYSNALTVAEGKAIGSKLLTSMTNTLASGSMQKMADDMFADEIEWIWSGPQVGKGSKEDLVKEFAGSWGAMVSAFNPTHHPYIVVDTGAKKVSVAFDVTITIDGHSLAPCYNTLSSIFTLTVNDEGKVTVWEGMWDSGDVQTAHCMGLVMASKKADL